MDVVFSPRSRLRNWKYETRFILDLFHRGFNAATVYGFHVEQDEFCFRNVQNFNVKVTKTQYSKLLNLKVFEVVQSKKYKTFENWISSKNFK